MTISAQDHGIFSQKWRAEHVHEEKGVLFIWKLNGVHDILIFREKR